MIQFKFFFSTSTEFNKHKYYMLDLISKKPAVQLNHNFKRTCSQANVLAFFLTLPELNVRKDHVKYNAPNECKNNWGLLIGIKCD